MTLVRRLHIACFAAALAGCGDTLFLMFEQHLETPEGERLVGAGCESITDGTSGNAGTGLGPASFSIEHEGHDDEGVRVIVRDGTGRVVATRVYNDRFLRSAEVDEFAAELGQGHSLRLRYWGGTTCEDPGEPDG